MKTTILSLMAAMFAATQVQALPPLLIPVGVIQAVAAFVEDTQNCLCDFCNCDPCECFKEPEKEPAKQEEDKAAAEEKPSEGPCTKCPDCPESCDPGTCMPVEETPAPKEDCGAEKCPDMPMPEMPVEPANGGCPGSDGEE